MIIATEDSMDTGSGANVNPVTGAELTCRELVEVITDYLEGALPPLQHARFEAHLRECPLCCAYVADLQILIQQIGATRESLADTVDRARLLELFQHWRESI
jgi:anti-sigma factor RsiW